jgi:uncharacterized membrane protein YkoI
MRKFLIIAAMSCLLAPALAGARAVPTEPQAGPGASDAATFQSRGMSLEEAVRQVRRQYGGRIVSAETRGSGDRRVHVIKVLTKDGRVRTVRIPAG